MKKLDFVPSIYTDLFELNCRKNPVPKERMEAVALKQASKLCDVYEEQVVSPHFNKERVDELEDILIDLVFLAVRRSLDLEIHLCKEERALYVSFGAPFFAFYNNNLILLEKIVQNAFKMAFYNNKIICIFLLDK